MGRACESPREACLVSSGQHVVTEPYWYGYVPCAARKQRCSALTDGKQQLAVGFRWSAEQPVIAARDYVVGFDLGHLAEHDAHDIANGKLPCAADGFVLVDHGCAVPIGDPDTDGSLSSKLGVNPLVAAADAAGAQVDNRSLRWFGLLSHTAFLLSFLA
jgi:hypothetical protein